MTQINSAITVVMAVTSTTSHGTEMAQSTAKATPSGASGDGSDLSGTSSGSQGSSGKPSTGNAGSGGSTKSGSPQASTCTGAIAGGVVGALVGGALIAFLITFLIMSRRRKKHYRRRSLSGSEKTVRRPLSASEGPAAPPVVDPRYAWELHLPQAADNPTLQQKVNGLYDRLELHIENFYSDSPHMAAGQTVSDVDWNRMAQQLQTPYLPMAAGALLQQSRARTIVMKHCLVYMVIAGVDPRASPLFPLLPREMTEVVQAVARGDKTKPALNQALIRHAQLTAYLLSPVSTTLPDFIPIRDEFIASAVDTICTAFAPWATNAATLQVRMDNLTQIMREASDTGIMLYGQPDRLAWRWKLVGADSRKLVVAPAFVRVKVEEEGVSKRRGEEAQLVAGRIYDF